MEPAERITANSRFSRRGLLATLLAAWAAPRLEGEVPNCSPALRKTYPEPSHSRELIYRADAVVQVLGLRVFSRENVGGGEARLERAPGRLSLRFAAGSNPDRAKGLNRIGYVEEQTATGEDGTARSSTYGFITETREQTFEESRRALNYANAEAATYTVLEARGHGARVDARVFRVETEARLSWPGWREVLAAVSTAQPASEPRQTSVEFPWGRTATSFLGAVHEAMQAGAGQGQRPYVYNGQLYSLTWRSTASEGMVRMDALIRNRRTGAQTPFQLWFDGNNADPLPCRIEYQPRGFLRLTFVQTESVPPARNRSVVTEEEA
jgi:hypothetical protein